MFAVKFFWGEILQWTSLRQENALAQAASRQIHRKPQARRNLLGKIYYIYILCALVFTDPVYSQTKWSVPLKIALMNWLFETWTASRFKNAIMNWLFEYFTVPKFAISQSEAKSTVLIPYDIKSLTWTLNFGPNLGTVNT